MKSSTAGEVLQAGDMAGLSGASSLSVGGESKPHQSASAKPRQVSIAVISLLTLSGVLFLWWAVTEWGYVDPLFLPSPQAVLVVFFDCSRWAIWMPRRSSIWQPVCGGSAWH